MTKSAATNLPYYSAEEIAGMDLGELLELQNAVQGTAWIASQARNAKTYGRCQFLLERLIYPAIDKRRSER